MIAFRLFQTPDCQKCPERCGEVGAWKCDARQQPKRGRQVQLAICIIFPKQHGPEHRHKRIIALFQADELRISTTISSSQERQ